MCIQETMSALSELYRFLFIQKNMRMNNSMIFFLNINRLFTFFLYFEFRFQMKMVSSLQRMYGFHVHAFFVE